MPLSKSGSYHANPAHARMHDQHSAPAAPEQPEGGAEAPPAHTVEIHHPTHPETGDGQNYHLRAHHADGSMQESKHPTLDDASDAAKSHFGEPPEAEPENESEESESDDDSDDDTGSDADDEY